MSVLGIITMPAKRQRMRRTWFIPNELATFETESARVAVPCRMMSGSPAARAYATSVWIGFQMRAHSV